MSIVTKLPRAWITIHVPGTNVEAAAATYFSYPADGLPQPPEDVQSLSFLREAPRHPESYMAHAVEWAEQDVSLAAISSLLGSASLPDDLFRFLDGEGLRDRLRSATDAYFDLGHFCVPIEGGRLMHLVSDSQWVYHWLLYVGDSGDSAVVGTTFPAGFRLDDDEGAFWADEAWGYTHVADSFAEFAWRWWMDNEVFYRLKVDGSGLSTEHQRYVNGYGPSSADRL